MGFFRTYRFIATHPLGRRNKLAAVSRWLKWQVGSRILRHSIAVPFVGGMRMLVETGMTGATGNIYCGLHEFEDMAFVLHFLRPGELFVDVGANIGSYTLLAAATGARVISFEPVPATYERLLDNIHLNRIEAQADCRNEAVGAHMGSMAMTADQDTTNKALGANENYSGQTVEVRQVRLDDALHGLGAPKLIKIDVEGFETEVVEGAQATLADTSVEAIIMELNGSGRRYGFDEDQLHGRMLQLGFLACTYEPVARRMIDLKGARSRRGNTLYVRNLDAVQAKTKTSPRYRISGTDL